MTGAPAGLCKLWHHYSMEYAHEVKQAVLAAQVEASFQGQDKGPFESVEVIKGGDEARCRKCDQSAWVGDSGLMYSLLGDECLQNYRVLLSEHGSST